MYKKIFTAGICLLFVSLAAADKVNLLKNGDFSRYKVNWITDGEVKEEGKTGVLILSGKATRAFSRQVMELDARWTGIGKRSFSAIPELSQEHSPFWISLHRKTRKN